MHNAEDSLVRHWTYGGQHYEKVDQLDKGQVEMATFTTRPVEDIRAKKNCQRCKKRMKNEDYLIPKQGLIV